MTRPMVKTIRRLALLAAVAVALILVGSYGLRRWRAYQARQAVPAAIPTDVRQQAQKFTFSRSEGDQTLFTVEASRTIEREGKTTVLEDVVAVIRGRQGDRDDQIRTARCEYDAEDSGDIYCPGKVTIELADPNAETSPESSRPLQIVTAGMYFDPEKGAAWTKEAVQFSFPEGSGQAVGLRYQPGEPGVRLEEQVKIQLSRGADSPIHIEGSRLLYYARRQALVLLPPLSLRLEDRRLVADRIRMDLDDNFRTRRIVAAGNVRAQGRHDGRQLTMRARRAVALYSPDGTLRQLKASGSVTLIRQGKDSREVLTCREAVLHFDALGGRVERVVARGDSRLILRRPLESRELSAPVLVLRPAKAGDDRRVLIARRRGSLLLEDSSGERRTIEARRIRLLFRRELQLRNLAASGDVETMTVRPDGIEQKTWSEYLRASFDEAGRLAQAEQREEFRYESDTTRAEAGRATYDSANETFALTDEPVVWDATTRTTAKVIEVEQTTGVLRAEGQVRTTHRAAGSPGSGFGSGRPVNLVAERLRAERERGWARYEGHARMWEGENRLAAASIELFRSENKLVAEDDVTSLFVETPVAVNGPAKLTRRRVVRVTAQRFTYLQAERRGVFEEEVKAWNDFGTLTAPRLEVFLTAEEGRGSQRIERARAQGGVRIKQPDREAASERADYNAEAQTVVLSGGQPIITDGRGSSVTGTQLTLFLADGRIRVDSGKGERTITRRPWTQ